MQAQVHSDARQGTKGSQAPADLQEEDQVRVARWKLTEGATPRLEMSNSGYKDAGREAPFDDKQGGCSSCLPETHFNGTGEIVHEGNANLILADKNSTLVGCVMPGGNNRGGLACFSTFCCKEGRLCSRLLSLDGMDMNRLQCCRKIWWTRKHIFNI